MFEIDLPALRDNPWIVGSLAAWALFFVLLLVISFITKKWTFTGPLITALSCASVFFAFVGGALWYETASHEQKEMAIEKQGYDSVTLDGSHFIANFDGAYFSGILVHVEDNKYIIVGKE